MKRLLSILVVCSCLLTGCTKAEESRVSSTTSIDWSGDKVTIEGSLPDMEIAEIIETDEATKESNIEQGEQVIDVSEETVANTGEVEQEELTSFDYFIYAYYIVSPVTVTADVTYLTDAYIKAETNEGVTYTYNQEADEYGVTDIVYEFSKDGTRKSHIIFDTTNLDVNLIVEKMQEMMEDESAQSYGAKFTKTENGFECTDILGIAAAFQFNMEASFDSKIILTINEDNTMRLDICPIIVKDLNENQTEIENNTETENNVESENNAESIIESD